MKTSITSKKSCIVVSIEKALANTEFTELKREVLQKVSKESIHGIVIDLHALDVIDSFCNKNIKCLCTFSRREKSTCCFICIKPVVAEVMKRQGLNFPDKLVNKGADVSEGLAQLEEPNIIINKGTS